MKYQPQNPQHAIDATQAFALVREPAYGIAMELLPYFGYHLTMKMIDQSYAQLIKDIERSSSLEAIHHFYKKFSAVLKAVRAARRCT